MKDKLNSDLCPRYSDNLFLTYDVSQVSALKESQDLLTKRVIDLWKNNLINLNEARYELDYELVENGDMYYSEVMNPFADIMPSEEQPKSLNDFETKDKKKTYGKELKDKENRFTL
jgi:hypothetical protein